jgi:hypothetical protein
MLHLLRALTPSQRSAVLASYLGWTVDAFDFFIRVFVPNGLAAKVRKIAKVTAFTSEPNSSAMSSMRKKT